MFYRSLASFTILACLVSACTAPIANPVPTLAGVTLMPEQTPFTDLQYQSSGGGELRSPGYWLIWNSCAEGNQSETARANGGREAGWILMDDLLTNPGILLGKLQVEACQQGVNLLQARNLAGVDTQSDPAYTLAAQLLAAQLNNASGSRYCTASDQAISQAQLLLIKVQFDGTGSYLGPPLLHEDVETAKALEEQLTRFNNGTLCTQ